MQSIIESQPAACLQTRSRVERCYALPSNGEFVSVLDACRDLGGLARAQEVARMTVFRSGPNARKLASWILDRQLLSFEWQSQIWIPLFQFDRLTMALHQGFIEVLEALSRTFEPWEQALWLSQPNYWLGKRIPALVLILDHEAVVRAVYEEQLVSPR